MLGTEDNAQASVTRYRWRAPNVFGSAVFSMNLLGNGMDLEREPRGEGYQPGLSAWVDQVAEILTSRRCQTVLRVFAEKEDDEMELSMLASEVLAREDGGHAIGRDLVILDLHHRSLPKLDDAGIVDYQDRTVWFEGDEVIEGLAEEMAEADPVVLP